MAETHVISALVAKRAEIAGLIAHHRKEVARLSEEAKTLDATIKLFEPGYRTQSIKPKRYQKKNSFFKHGEAHRMILDALRESENPITTHQIAKSIMTIKGIGADSEKDLQASILTILHRQKKDKMVEMVGKDTQGNCIWKLADF
ncbi:MAG: hypothetical protein ACXWUF_20335 [Methylomagnum sp.]